MEASRDFSIPGTPNLVLCSVPNEEKLHLAAHALRTVGIRAVLFKEPDLGDQATALATEAVTGEHRKHFRKFKLIEESDMLPIAGVSRAVRSVEGENKSKWGYHNCDRETGKLLRSLMRCYQRTMSQLAAWHRWNRKLPANRVWRTYLYNDKDQRIGVKETAPMLEPKVCDILTICSGSGPKLADAAYRFRRWHAGSRHPSPVPVHQLNNEELSMIRALAKMFAEYEAR